MALSNIRVKPLTAAIGAEVDGVDLSEPLSDDTFQVLHDALMTHYVIFFRDQEMTLDQHKDLAEVSVTEEGFQHLAAFQEETDIKFVSHA